MKKKLIIFDFDGVILDSFDASYKYLSTMNKDLGLFEITSQMFPDLYMENYWEGYKKRGIPKEVFERIKTYMKKKTPIDMTVRICVGIPELLLKLSDLFQLAIVSSGDEKYINDQLKNYNIGRFFSIVLGFPDRWQ